MNQLNIYKPKLVEKLKTPGGTTIWTLEDENDRAYGPDNKRDKKVLLYTKSDECPCCGKEKTVDILHFPPRATLQYLQAQRQQDLGPLSGLHAGRLAFNPFAPIF